MNWTNPGLYFLGALVLWLAAGAALRHRSPVGYWYAVGYPLAWVRITSTWRPLCVERGLSTARRSGQALVGDLIVRGQDLRPRVPRIIISRPVRNGLTVRVRLLPGQTPEEFAAASDAFMHAWRMETVKVTSPARGQVEITCYRTDPLSGVVVRDPEHPAAPVAGTGRVVLVFAIGVTERAKAWLMNLRACPHYLIVGATQAGKSTLIHAVVSRLAPLPVALIGIDLKGGLELSVYQARLSGLATTRSEALEILLKIRELMDERMAQCKAANVRAVWELPEPPPPIAILIDEIAELYLITDNSEKAVRDQTAMVLLRLAQLGAALDIHLLIGAQRFGSDLGQWVTALRAQLGGRICMHVSDPETAIMTLGDLWPEAVAAAQMLTPEHRGFAVASDGEGSWMRARATLTTVDEAIEAARANAHLTPVLPGITTPQDGRGGGS